ncbi:hypothetical protein ACFVRR_21335 [Gottfriedia sp. NPDC057948]
MGNKGRNIAIGDNGDGQVFLMHQGDNEKEFLVVYAEDMTPAILL